MSCAILNTVKLCINEAQTDISREKVLSYIDGVVNLEREGKDGGKERAITSFFQSFMRDFMRAISAMLTICLHNSETVSCFNWKRRGEQTDRGSVALIKRNMILMS